MSSIDRRIGSIREDHRADYLFNTKVVANHLRCHPNKFHARWYRTRAWLMELVIAQPGETSAELCAIIAQGVAERERRGL